MREEINTIWPNELRDYLQSRKESDYLLVDVRQPKEYTQEHIPGARLIPLKSLTAAPPDLPKDKDLIFYCRKGLRSRVAADFCADSGFTPKRIFSLAGGITAWEEAVLPDFPKIQIFAGLPNLSDLLPTAMNLEKGAFLFYSYLIDKLADSHLIEELKQIAGMETAHARILFDLLPKDTAPTFQDYFEALSGEIIEGGLPLNEACQRLNDLPGDLLVNAQELALEIEYSAYDLYRTLANQQVLDDKAEIFLNLAQAEKNHIQKLAQLFDQP